MKTVAFAGPRLFMKFADLEYFRTRAKTEGLEIVEVHADDEKEFVEQVKDAHALAVIARRVSAQTIAALNGCELIQTLSVGYDCVDVAAATAAGIPVCNTPAYCTDEVANHALTLLMSAARKIPMIVPETRGGTWDYNFTRPIFNFRDKTLGILGMGRVGRALVPKAKGLGIRVCAYDPYLDDDIFAMMEVDRCYELADILEQSDYVSIHAPLTAETRGMIGKDQLGLMKPSALIVNTARGGIWDEDAVADALGRGAIAAAATDVLGSEPPDTSHPFFSLPNMLVTPHIAWYSEESHRKNMVDSMDEIVRVLSGLRPHAIINPEIFGRTA
jgi:D-3-phosphoglycerate dehydrogenase / 2-oxoglutarate reductase